MSPATACPQGRTPGLRSGSGRGQHHTAAWRNDGSLGRLSCYAEGGVRIVGGSMETICCYYPNSGLSPARERGCVNLKTGRAKPVRHREPGRAVVWRIEDAERQLVIIRILGRPFD